MLLRRFVVPPSLALAILVCAAGAAAAANVCPPLNPPQTDSDDRRRTEESFNAENFADALRYFEEDLPRDLRETSTTEAVRSTESFMIGYPNVITVIKGYALRQDVLLRMAERDLVVEKNRRGRASKGEASAANARFSAAKQRFCDFVKNAYYSD
jgi:hypothetical protein